MDVVGLQHGVVLAGGSLHAFPVSQGHVGEVIQLAVLESDNGSGVLGNDAVLHVLDVGSASPVAVIGLQLDEVGIELGQDVGAGAGGVGLGAELLAGGDDLIILPLADHLDSPEGVGDGGIGIVQRKDNSLFVLRGDVADEAGNIVEAGVLHGQLIAEHHILGSQGVSVLEGSVLQRNGVGQAVLADGNVLGQQVKVAAVGLVHAVQTFKHMNPQDLHVVGQGGSLPVGGQQRGCCAHVKDSVLRCDVRVVIGVGAAAAAASQQGHHHQTRQQESSDLFHRFLLFHLDLTTFFVLPLKRVRALHLTVCNIVLLIVHNEERFRKSFCENCCFLEKHTIPSRAFCAKS